MTILKFPKPSGGFICCPVCDEADWAILCPDTIGNIFIGEIICTSCEGGYNVVGGVIGDFIEAGDGRG